jgi:spore coat polysaccharide biosynthesis protein SpsF (cytidylyltransferase family)
MKYVTIIQARTTSSRLPAKCFLPVANMPLTILCAKRASSLFAETWVAISDHESDDLLANYLETLKIPYFRGHLTNVLNRFATLCLKLNLNPDDTIIRLTGDNPLVDSTFLEKMKVIWENYNFDYLSAQPDYLSLQPDNLIKYGWPKGLSAEFFKAESLYAINSHETDEYQKEHVTPGIKKYSKRFGHMAKFEKLGFDFKRSYSIDTLEDYLYVASLFQKVDWNESYIKILEYEKNRLS